MCNDDLSAHLSHTPSPLPKNAGAPCENTQQRIFLTYHRKVYCKQNKSGDAGLGGVFLMNAGRVQKTSVSPADEQCVPLTCQIFPTQISNL
jgi:hypothetical protein